MVDFYFDCKLEGFENPFYGHLPHFVLIFFICIVTTKPKVR